MTDRPCTSDARTRGPAAAPTTAARRHLAARVAQAALIGAACSSACREPAAPAPRADRTGGRAGAPAATATMDTPLGATEVRMTVAALVEQTLTDPQALDAQYQLKTLEVTGVVLGVDLADPEMTKVVVGKQLGSKETPCVCQGKQALRSAARALTQGQPITVRGKLAGMVQMAVVLLNCELVPATPPATGEAPQGAGG